MVSIRLARHADIHAIHQLGSHVPEFSVNEQTVSFWPLETLSNVLASEDVILLVAESDSKIIGFILATYARGLKKSTIENIFVEPTFRNNKVGAQLLESLLQELSTIGCEYVATLIPESSDGALDLYLNAGFSQGENFVWFDKSLSKNFKRH